MPANNSHRLNILLAEDDEDDRILLSDALGEIDFEDDIIFTRDGQELMDYLHQCLRYQQRAEFCLPSMIIMDLNMPRKNGREVLQELKQHPSFCKIPVVILTTSQEQTDVTDSYELGVSSYITKPQSFEGLISTLQTIRDYWFNTVNLPV